MRRLKFSRRTLYLLVVCIVCFYMVARVQRMDVAEAGVQYARSFPELILKPMGYKRSLAGVLHFSSEQLVQTHRQTTLDSCREKSTDTRIKMRGTEYWVAYNYIKPTLKFKCNETITITSHTEIPYLHNLEPLLERWNGPVSVAVFTPGSDYQDALEAVHYYRQCTNTTLVLQYVTFHFYFPINHLPSHPFMSDEFSSNYKANCDQPPPNIDRPNGGKKWVSYKSKHKLTYPINVGRNVAREAAATHFVFASDIELYPSPGLIPTFLDMVRSSDNGHNYFIHNNTNPRVYVNTIFEMKSGLAMPENKTVLLQYLARGDVIPFHKYVCPACHLVPKYEEWKTMAVNEQLDISTVAKRRPPYIDGKAWEPIYIGTNEDPFYDERLTWDGRAEKMSQAYVMCVLDYDFMVLDNAFLIHRPGIKKSSSSGNTRLVRKQENLIKRSIVPELQRIYGVREGCQNYV